MFYLNKAVYNCDLEPLVKCRARGTQHASFIVRLEGAGHFNFLYDFPRAPLDQN